MICTRSTSAVPDTRFSACARWIQIAALIAVMGAISGCASPTSKIVALTEEAKLKRSSVVANGFQHFVVQNTVPLDPSGTLHVYLEGDGSPWKYRVLRMKDPTPRQPLMLKLLGLDTRSAVYLGRPCYYGNYADKGCSDDLWTSARYSEVVVASMTSALTKLAKARGAKQIRLFGHSGGGTLAYLIAARVPEVTQIVTLAANLDIDAWVAHHSYSPLYESLNPAKQPRLRRSVRQWHFFGRKDTVVPPSIIQPFVKTQDNAFGTVIGTFGHGCCWQRIWPTILKGIDENNTRNIPGMRFKFPKNVDTTSQ